MILDGKALADASLQDEMLETERARKQQEAMSQFTQMARQAAQEQAAQQAAQDPLNAIQRQIAYNLVGAKQAYKDALANGDTEGMAAAHGAADSFRNQGNAIGWNGDGYGQGVTLEQAAQNLANNDARALANIFYNQQNADDHYTMEIANLLDKGYSIDSAKRMAAQSADRLDRKNNAELIDSFATYGLDPRGVLTNNGVRILGELAQNGNSELANFYANMYAKPVQNWGWENQLIAAANADRYARGRQVLSGEIQNQLSQNNWERNEITKNNDVQRYLAKAEGMVGIKALDAQTQAAVRSNIVKPLVDNNLVTPEVAANYVATGYLVPKGTAPTKEKEKAPTRAEMGVYNQLADLLETAQNDIRTGAIYSMPDGEGSVEAYRLAVEDAIGKGYLTGSDITKARDYAFMLQYMLAMNADTPDTEWASQAYSNMSPEFKKENADTFNNIKPKNQTKDGNQKEFSWEKREKPNGNGGKF